MVQELGLGPSLALDIAADLLDPTPIVRSDKLLPYRYDWAAAAHDLFTWKDGESLTEYQDEILDAVPRKKKVCVRGPHGLGKTTMMALAIHIFALTRDGDDWKAPVTASVWRQLTKYTWPEVNKWARRIRWDRVGREPYDMRRELQKQALQLHTGSAFLVASDIPENIEGAHADYLFYGIDEGKTVIAGTFDGIEGAFSGAGGHSTNEAYAFCISTPGEPNGRFHDIQMRRPGYEDWWVRHVTLEEAIKAGRITPEWAEQRARQWGRTSTLYKNKVEGNFALDAVDGVIPLQWVEEAMARWDDMWPKRGNMTALGVDVARTGSDKSCFAPRYSNIFGPVISEHYTSTSEVEGMALELIRPFAGGPYVAVDVIGIGAGVVDGLSDSGVDVEPFNASHRSEETDITGNLEFLNRRAEAWWTLRDALNPTHGFGVALPPDDELLGDLTSPRYKRTAGGKIQVEEKEKIRERLGRSPDKGDAVVMAIAMRRDDQALVAVYDAAVRISPF